MEVAVLRAYHELKRRNPRYAKVILRLLGQSDDGTDLLGAHASQGECAMESPTTRCRARRRFGLLLALELRATVADDDAFAEEWGMVRQYVSWLKDADVTS